MLTSLLPGLRDLRTPLATGYIVMLLLWLAVADRFPSREEARGDLRRVYEMISAMGTPAAVTALSFSAYLMGSLLVIRDPPKLLSTLGWLGGNADTQQAFTEYCSFIANQLRPAVWEPTFSRLWPDEVAEELSRLDLETSHAKLAGYVRDELSRELPLLAPRLHSAPSGLYDAYDRFRAEAELRLSVSPPLVCLFGYLAAGFSDSLPLDSTLGAVCCSLAFAIFMQGIARNRDARNVVLQAVLQGVILSPFLERVADLVKRT